jgi:hypothetical protein
MTKSANPLPSAILHAFRPVANAEVAARLRQFGADDWARLGSWLQASGLGLYFLAELRRRGIVDSIPHTIESQLSQNLLDNRERTEALTAEFVRINSAFRSEGLDYLNVKGFSLGREYCPDHALRQQFDLDFLLDGKDAERCGSLMRQLGYSVQPTPRSMECRSGGNGYPKLRDFYRPPVQRSVEVHLRSSDEFTSLGRSHGMVDGFVFPTLSREQTFIYQALHLAKHLRSEWTRASWMLELRSAILDAADDTEFWGRMWTECPGNCAALVAVAVCASARVLGFEVPRDLATYAHEAMPDGVLRWIEAFSEEVVTASFPGTKLYLLLERELAGGKEEFLRKRRTVLMPLRVPGYVSSHGALRRSPVTYIRHAAYVAQRLRFHLREGMRLLRAERSWKQNGFRTQECVVNEGRSIA